MIWIIKRIKISYHNVKLAFFATMFTAYSNLMQRYRGDEFAVTWRRCTRKAAKWLKLYCDEVDTFWDKFYEK